VQNQFPPALFSNFSKQAALLISLLRLRAAFAISAITPCILQAGSMRSFAFGTWPSHALHQVRKQGCPSSLALSSAKEEIAHIPRFAALPGDAHRARGSLIFAPPQHAGCNASGHPSSSGQQSLRRLSRSLRDLGPETDVEIGLADLHPVHDTRELACNRDAQHARRLDECDHARTNAIRA
jgi:hypothetical protein